MFAHRIATFASNLKDWILLPLYVNTHSGIKYRLFMQHTHASAIPRCERRGWPIFESATPNQRFTNRLVCIFAGAAVFTAFPYSHCVPSETSPVFRTALRLQKECVHITNGQYLRVIDARAFANIVAHFRLFRLFSNSIKSTWCVVVFVSVAINTH